ncbi:hypothetical protein BG011_010128, partial [Mortierella polycephala]
MSSSKYNLPDDWELRWSRSRNLPYFYNRVSAESRWQAPEGVDPSVVLEFQKDYQTQHAQQQQDEHASGSRSSANEIPGTPKSVRVSHLLVKHTESRRPSSWRE